MLDNTARYVYMVYRLKSVSNAAKELYVSQPAISAAIQKAEKTLGAPIFNRKTLPFTLTEEGKIYIRSVEKMIQIEQEANIELQNLNALHRGTIRIVCSDHFSAKLIPQIMRSFHREYPQVSFHILWTTIDNLYQTTDKDLADIIFRPLNPFQSGYAISTLFYERSFVVMPKDTDIPEELRSCAISRNAMVTRNYPPEMIVSDLSLFRDVDFISIPNIFYINRRREELFGKYKVAPQVISSTDQMVLNFNLMHSGFGALLAGETQIATCLDLPDCLYFPLGGPNATQPYSVVHRKELPEYLRAPLNAFIKTAKNFCNCENPIMKAFAP